MARTPGHVPTSSQQTALTTLKTTQAAAVVTYHAAVVSLQTAETALRIANKAVEDYRQYIHGGVKPTVLDEGSADTA